ncbi:hypothetical protein ABK040_004845 [Willaertia magna]
MQNNNINANRLKTSSSGITPVGVDFNDSPKDTSTLKDNSTINKTVNQHSHTTAGVGKKRDHPLYCTSNSTYGAKPPSEATRPAHFHGSSHSFTKEFVGGMYRNHSLNTDKTRNSVLPDPTFNGNTWFQE